MTDLHTLLARIEAAEGSDRELDAAIWVKLADKGSVALKWAVDAPDDEWRSFGAAAGYAKTLRLTWGGEAPCYTASLDAALALVEAKIPNAGEISITRHPRRGHVKWEGEIEHRSKWTERGWTFTSDEAVNAPLAILAALLRALIKAEKLDGVG